MADERFEVAVVGAGAAGLCAALALAREGVATVLVGRHAPVADGRTVALLDGSVRFLKALGAWPALASEAAALAVLQIVDDTGSLFRPPPVRFAARELGLEAFGWNVESVRLVTALRALARSTPNLAVREADAESVAGDGQGMRIRLADDTTVCARLVVGADGARSKVRDAAGIVARVRERPQSALTTLLAHERPHRNVSTEFHTRQGPFTLVPLPGGRRSSLVWMTGRAEAERLRQLDDRSFAAAAERQAGSMLGAMRVDGPRGLVPMRTLSVPRPAAERTILVGEAAHVFPPIGAQGLNLGLRDAATLRDVIVPPHRSGADTGARPVLDGYVRRRALDTRLRGAAVDALNASLIAGLVPLDLARGAGLVALAAVGPLRRLVMREGMAPRLGVPELMRA